MQDSILQDRAPAQLLKELARLQKRIAELQSAEQGYRTIFENSAAAITVTNEKEQIISWNKFSESLLGMDKASLSMRKVSTLYPKAEWKRIRAYNVRRKGMQHHLETRMIKKDGSLIDVDIAISVLKDKDGKVTGSIGIVKDITETKKAEIALKESRKNLMLVNKKLVAKEKALKKTLSRMKKTNQELQKTQNMLIQSEKLAIVGQLAVGIAHEVKNPLAIILQGSEAIDRVLAQLDNKGKEYTQMIRSAAERANKVIIELLNFSRPSLLAIQPVKLHEIINSAIDLVSNKAKIENINIVCDYSPEINLIEGDAVLLEEVFLNLLANAVEASCKNIRIATRLSGRNNAASQDKQKVIIEIADDGSGISKENLKQLFEPFFTTKDKSKGTGLGLTLVLLILQRHNGAIKVDSKVGCGTRFIITLPA